MSIYIAYASAYDLAQSKVQQKFHTQMSVYNAVKAGLQIAAKAAKMLKHLDTCSPRFSRSSQVSTESRYGMKSDLRFFLLACEQSLGNMASYHDITITANHSLS